MKQIRVSPFDVPDYASDLIDIVRPYGRLREYEWTSPVSLSQPIVILSGYVGVGYLDEELDLRPTYLLVPRSVAMPLDPNEMHSGREPVLPMGARVLEMDTSIRWPEEVQAAFGQLAALELKRLSDWMIWLSTRNRMERVTDLHQKVGQLNSKQLSSLTRIPIKQIRERYRKFVRQGGRVSDAARLLTGD